MGKLVYFKWMVEDAKVLKENLSTEQIGELFVAVMDYLQTGTIKEVSKDIRFPYADYRNKVDRACASYDETCAKRAESGKKGGKAKAENAAKAVRPVPDQSKTFKPPTLSQFKNAVERIIDDNEWESADAYVDKMRAVLASLNTKAMTIGNAIEAAHNQLSVANANEKVWDLREQLQQAATRARDQIAVILQEATDAAKKWAELDGRKVDTADLELLRGDFNLDDEALHRLLVKHQANGVMVNAIAKYAKEHRIPLGNIPTVEGKIQAYNTMADGALKVIGSIVQSMGTDAETLAEWGKPGNVSQRIELALYGIPTK